MKLLRRVYIFFSYRVTIEHMINYTYFAKLAETETSIFASQRLGLDSGKPQQTPTRNHL